MKKYVIILACGNGTRMQASTPKQYLLVDDKPIVFHTIERIWQFDNTYNIIVVINSEHEQLFNTLKEQYSLNIPFNVVFGGKTRFLSVRNALDSIEDTNSLVAIHDGVRPFVSKEAFVNSFLVASQYGNAICAVTATDSIRMGSRNNNHAVNRQEVFLIQTPQTFLTSTIKLAYKQEYQEKFTDDASVLESFGKEINIIEGNRDNIKITYPSDLLIAQKILENK
jgi:2-C-methyl-D-erythritol 4-phosphate cytidylyltransferase